MNKKEYLTQIGKILVVEFGKQKFYTPDQIKTAHNKIKKSSPDYLSTSADILEFTVSMFSSVDDFIIFFTSSNSEYLKLKTEAVNEISSSDWDILPELDIDTSWLDIEDILDGIVEGAESFFIAIFD